MTLIVGLIALYLVLLCAVAWFSAHPYRIPIFLSPGSLGTPQENLSFESEGCRLSAWWVEGTGPNVAVFPHGYMMNRAELSPIAFRLWQEGMSCLLFDFRCHGRSQGRYSTLGWEERKDVISAVKAARARKPGAKVVLIGSSMGSSAAALAMGDDPKLADALVLDSAYGKLNRAIPGWWRFLGGKTLMVLLSPVVLLAWPLTGVNPWKVDVAEALKKLDGVPVLHLHGRDDDLALPSEAQRNHDACPGSSEIVWFENCQHSEARWVQPERFLAALLGFLQDHDILPKDADRIRS